MGQLQFQYYNWFQYTGPNNNRAPEGEQIGLESMCSIYAGSRPWANLYALVAYLLGPNLNNLDSDLQQFTTNTNTRDMDRFLVLHFHFRSFTHGGTRMVGIFQINIRHGSQVRSRRVINGVVQSGNDPQNYRWVISELSFFHSAIRIDADCSLFSSESNKIRFRTSPSSVADGMYTAQQKTHQGPTTILISSTRRYATRQRPCGVRVRLGSHKELTLWMADGQTMYRQTASPTIPVGIDITVSALPHQKHQCYLTFQQPMGTIWAM